MDSTIVKECNDAAVCGVLRDEPCLYTMAWWEGRKGVEDRVYAVLCVVDQVLAQGVCSTEPRAKGGSARRRASQHLASVEGGADLFFWLPSR